MNQLQSSRRFIEVAWGAKDGHVGYVFIDPMESSSFTSDPFFEHLSLTMTTTEKISPNILNFVGF